MACRKDVRHTEYDGSEGETMVHSGTYREKIVCGEWTSLQRTPSEDKIKFGSIMAGNLGFLGSGSPML